MHKRSTICIVAVIFAVSTITYTSFAAPLTKSIILSSMGTVKSSSPSTIVVQVSASHDDAGAWWDWSGFYWLWTLDKSHVSVGRVTEQYNGGLRFTNVNIPKGVKIVSAVLRVCAAQTCEGTGARWEIYGENVASAIEFSTKEEFEARPKTIAKVDTGFFTVWVEGTWYEVSNLTDVIQEIVNRSDWEPGNALAMLIFGHSEARTTHEIRSYDANPNQAAILEITY